MTTSLSPIVGSIFGIFQTEINDRKHFSSINQVFIEYDESKMIKVVYICYSCLLFAQKSDSL